MTASSELSPFYEGKTYYYIGEFNFKGPNVFLEKYTQNISEKPGKTSLMGHVLVSMYTLGFLKSNN